MRQTLEAMVWLSRVDWCCFSRLCLLLLPQTAVKRLLDQACNARSVRDRSTLLHSRCDRIPHDRIARPRIKMSVGCWRSALVASQYDDSAGRPLPSSACGPSHPLRQHALESSVDSSRDISSLEHRNAQLSSILALYQLQAVDCKVSSQVNSHATGQWRPRASRNRHDMLHLS